MPINVIDNYATQSILGICSKALVVGIKGTNNFEGVGMQIHEILGFRSKALFSGG
jgi:hypothetical protein